MSIDTGAPQMDHLVNTGTLTGSGRDMPLQVDWPRNDYSRIPFRLYHDEAIYALEMERIFRGPVWSYLALEAELPNPGDYRTCWVGDTPVVVSRNTDGVLHAF